MRSFVALAVAASAVAAALAAGAGRAAPAGAAWSRISGPTQPGNQLGLARTSDGVLHVVWNRGATPTSIFETRLSPAGQPAGTSTVANGWDGNQGLALLVMPDASLRLFAAGAVRSGSNVYGINTFTASPHGGDWTLQSGSSWGGAVAESSAVIGATLTRDGQPVTAWRGFAAEGLPPASIPQNPFVADQTASHLATDAASGAVVLAGVTIAGKGGVFVRQVLPSLGPQVVLPLPTVLEDRDNGLSGRIGAPGVYVAYADGKAAHLYRYGGGSKTLGRGAFTSATVCAGPEGRLWVAWGDTADGLFVTRSNRAASAFEPMQKLRAPSGSGLTYLQCEGSAGPVDLFAD
ncbi:MAG TPA: hypothetical protein VFB26_09250, partial [Gaiellaceae bacterium]|nr:hypothetical protein [Gaiellaceae bacterium]